MSILRGDHDAVDDAVSEVTPLLVNAEALPVGTKASEEDISHINPANTDGESETTLSQDDKIPAAQIFYLCCTRLIDPIAFFGIFPFVNQMIFDTNEVPEVDVGFYSGLIESIFSIVAMCATVPWGKLADHPQVGRKPVLVVSIIGLSICTALFGLSKTIVQMFLTRCSAGMFAGSIVTIRTMMAENSTPKTQARIFSYFAFSGNLGIFIGPLVGGALATPAKQYGGIFKRSRFFQNYPFALPSFVIGVMGLMTAILVIIFVKETLNTKTSDSSKGDQRKPMSILDLIKAPGVAMVLFLNCHIMLLAFSFTAVIPVFYFTSPAKGGFGLTPLQISIFMALAGLSQAIWLLVVFPWMQQRWSTGTVLRACARAYPFFFFVLPLYNVVLRQGWTNVFWTTGPVVLMLGSGVAMSFTAIQLAINDVNPNPSTLGTLNSLALALVSGIRSFSPALFTTIFAIGVRKRILAGYLVWLIMIILAAAFTVDVQFLPRNAEGRTEKKQTEDDREA